MCRNLNEAILDRVKKKCDLAKIIKYNFKEIKIGE